MNSASSPLKGRQRTLQGVLRERLPQIEATSKAGYRMRTIVEQLAQEGFHATLGFRDGAAISRAAEPLAAFVDLIADAVADGSRSTVQRRPNLHRYRLRATTPSG